MTTPVSMTDTPRDDKSRVLERLGMPEQRGALDALAALPLALNSTLELRAVLRLLIEASLVVSRADRCSIFTLHEGRWLKPTVALGKHINEDQWTQFRALPPIEVPLDVAVHRELLDGRAVPIMDVTRSRVISPALIEAFDLQSVVLVPLLAAKELCGLLAVDYQRRHESTPDELTGLEMIASYAGLAVRNAQLYDEERRRARLHESLARGAAELVSGRDAIRICQALASAYETMLDAESCSIGVLDDDNRTIRLIRTDASECAINIDDVPAELSDQVADNWSTSLEPIVVTSSPWLAEVSGVNGSRVMHALVPLTVRQEIRGIVYLGFRNRAPLEPDESAAASGLAAIASTALERAMLVTTLQEQVARLDTLYHLSEVIGVACKPSALRRRLNELLAETGYRVERIEVHDRRIARRLSWPADMSSSSAPKDATAVPIRAGRHVIGTLHVTPSPAPIDGFLEAVAAGVAEALTRGAAQVAIHESTRDKALAGERERIALDLHDTVGQSFVATMLLANRAAEELPRDSDWAARFERIAGVAAEGKWSLDQAVRALAFVPEARAGLPAALRAFSRSVSEDSGLHIEFHTVGRTRRLTVPVERALYRVGHQAISNAWRHARASVVSVSLSYRDDAVTLRVQDNGVGVALRPDGTLHGVGFTSMRRAISGVGGRLTVAGVDPSGLAVEAVVPRRAA